MITPSHLREIARHLYGTAYVSPLAAALGVSRRTVLRWLNASRGASLRVSEAELAEMLEEHGRASLMMARNIRAMIK